MSKRRKIGDRVWVVPGAAFNASRGQWAVIVDWPSNIADELFPCILNCEDDDCMEWNDLVTDGGYPLYHVSECEMLDEPSNAEQADKGE